MSGLRIVSALLATIGTALAIVLIVWLVRDSSGSETPQYDVTVQFSESARQEEIEQVEARLRSFDDELDFLILEIFPPIGRAVVSTDAPGFCLTVRTELEAESYVDGVSCSRRQGDDHPAEPDAPVRNDEVGQ